MDDYYKSYSAGVTTEKKFSAHSLLLLSSSFAHDKVFSKNGGERLRVLRVLSTAVAAELIFLRPYLFNSYFTITSKCEYVRSMLVLSR